MKCGRTYDLKEQVRSGSLTVEAACIMPVILLAVFACLYLCFYVHNRAFLTSAACESAVCGSLAAVKEGGKPYETARERSIVLGNTGFFFAEDLHTYTLSGTESGDDISVYYEFDTAFDRFVLRRHLKASGSAEIIRPASDIRNARRGK